MAGSVGADPRIGSEIAGYRIERLLGRGGMAVVYLAYHERLDRHVALKLLAPEIAEDDEFRERFLRESRLAAALDHANVIPIHDAGEADGVLFIAMRYVEGCDFGALLKEEPVSTKRSLAILERVASALDAAHARGLVHRDVKPENVLLAEAAPGEPEHVYLTDFGLSARLGDRREHDEDASGVLGSLDYLAPEQIEDGEVSAKTDVYALGCVVFRALTGEAPFAGKGRLAMMWAHLDEAPPSARMRNPELPAALDIVLERAMAKDASGRQESCGALIKEARAALGLGGAPGEAASLSTRSRWRRPALLAAALATIVVAAVVPTLLLTRGATSGTVGDDWSQVPHVESVFGGVEQVVGVGLAARDGTLVAVGTEGDFSDIYGDRNGVAWASTDGVSWTRRASQTLAGEGRQFLSEVAAGPDGFVAVGGELYPDARWDEVVAAAWTSPDGLEWSRAPHSDDVFGSIDDPGAEEVWWMTDVTRGGPGFVAVGWDSTAFRGPAVWTSPDGVSWSRAPRDPRAFAPRFGPGFAQMLGVAMGAGGQPLVAVGHDTTQSGREPQTSAAVWVSQDGVAWTRVPHDDAVFGGPSRFVQMDDVVAGGPGFVAVGVDAGAEQRIEGRLPFAIESLGPGAVGPGRLSGAIWTSPDGLSWKRLPESRLPQQSDEKVRLHAVAAGSEGLVAVGWRGEGELIDPAVWTSADGETWTQASDPGRALRGQGGQYMADVLVHGQGLVAIGATGVVFGFNTAVWTSP